MSKLNQMAGLYAPFAYESVTVTNTSTTLTASTYLNASRAFMTVETAAVRYRVDGAAPTSAEGHLLNIGDVLTLIGLQTIRNFKAIRTGATSGVLKVTYEEN